MDQLFAGLFKDMDPEVRAMLTASARIVVILVLAWVVQALAGRLIRIFRRVMETRSTSADELRRIGTVGNAFRYFAIVVVVLVAGMLILGELGISIAPILATAGVAGVAIGFGAQSLIKDYFTGFFLLLEDQVREGDVVEVAGKAGVVEEVTLRYLRLRDADGRVIFVPNGEIKIVVNNTREHMFAIVDATIATKQDVAAALDAMREAGAAMRADARFGPMMLGDIEIWGIERWELWGLQLRGRIKVRPLDKDTVRREFSRRLVAAFEEKGIEGPTAWPLPQSQSQPT
ncbi:MAG: mechanosensitive ion channel family protein [Betaproteobacteria bacterium]